MILPPDSIIYVKNQETQGDRFFLIYARLQSAWLSQFEEQSPPAGDLITGCPNSTHEQVSLNFETPLPIYQLSSNLKTIILKIFIEMRKSKHSHISMSPNI